MNKITVIGTGSVGSTIAYTLAVEGTASDIVLIDINKEKAIGEAHDIQQGTPFCAPVNVYAGDYSDAAGSDIVIITSGIPRKAGQSRLELAQTNVNVTKAIAPEITKYCPDATYIFVSNPVDILTYTFHKITDIPENKIIGSGTILDTARLRAKLAENYAISQQNVHAYVFGEHGDSSFVPWSIANIANIPVNDYQANMAGNDTNFADLDYAAIEEHVRKAGGQVIARKGATFYAVAISVCHLVKCLLSGTDTTLTVSTMMHGEYGIDDVCLSTLNVVGRKEVRGRILTPLTDAEIALLQKSAESLKSVIKNLDI